MSCVSAQSDGMSTATTNLANIDSAITETNATVVAQFGARAEVSGPQRLGGAVSSAGLIGQ
jgi:flagellar basal body rod protein FlgC